MNKLTIWLPAIRAGSGADMYTIRLGDALKRRGINATITWFNHYLEFAPFVNNGKIPNKTNIIIANSWNAFAFKHPSIPLISIAYHSVFDIDFLKYKSLSQKLYHNGLIYYYEKLSFKKSDTVIAISQYTADSYKKTFTIKNLDVIHCWIDTKLFTPSYKNKYNKKFRLLFIGNWSKKKRR